MTSGAKVGGPQRFQTGSQTPEPTRASARASGQTPAGRRRSPRAASPASPRKPRRRPTLPAFQEPGSQDPHSNGAAGNWPLDFLRPDPGEGRAVGGLGESRLPPSCFRPGVYRI
ncbi:small integral membrane protein 15 isoform X1 [Cervus elaphus]|uniref:small integral membrane protein 15 isoform X1 n=1 Tax=Cervus canadensis TaxID=1574408 RepID=UPI001C9E66E1|nr:small integral membrane protein 15 isoform X1 [Cervus canadensis]XP_043743095.1 small integral membrane protein 15 isoform X1 [Cervus elaphus]